MRQVISTTISHYLCKTNVVRHIPHNVVRLPNSPQVGLEQ